MNGQECEAYEVAVEELLRVQNILNVLVTMERLAVSMSAAMLDGNMGPPLSPLHLQAERQAMLGGVANFALLESLRARALTETFSTEVGRDGVLETEERLTVVLLAACTAAVRELVTAGESHLAQSVFRIGMVHAEHAGALRALGVQAAAPPDPSQTSERDHHLSVQDAYRLLEGLGLFESRPVPLAYPSADKIAARGSPVVPHPVLSHWVPCGLPDGPAPHWTSR